MEDVTTPPQKCCGEWPNREDFDFYVCHKCNGEIIYEWIDDNEFHWVYDCPRGEPPRSRFGV